VRGIKNNQLSAGAGYGRSTIGLENRTLRGRQRDGCGVLVLDGEESVQEETGHVCIKPGAAAVRQGSRLRGESFFVVVTKVRYKGENRSKTTEGERKGRVKEVEVGRTQKNRYGCKR